MGIIAWIILGLATGPAADDLAWLARQRTPELTRLTRRDDG
jgi:hypothetical protein